LSDAEAEPEAALAGALSLAGAGEFRGSSAAYAFEYHDNAMRSKNPRTVR
jgi:hypothetical protein